MTTQYLQKIGKYTVGSNQELGKQQIEEIARNVALDSQKAIDPLSGRAHIQFGQLEGIGNIAIKHYKRGGVLGKVVASRYLRLGEVRSRQEFELLQTAASIGVNVPEPIAYVYTSGVFYRAWLITRRIENHRTLASLTITKDGQFETIMKELVSQVEKLIHNKIFHIDLHPGNVLIDEFGKVYLLDFDKAYHFRGNVNILRDKYLCRWRRAVLKHNLSDLFSEFFCSGLRKHYEN